MGIPSYLSFLSKGKANLKFSKLWHLSKADHIAISPLPVQRRKKENGMLSSVRSEELISISFLLLFFVFVFVFFFFF